MQRDRALKCPTCQQEVTVELGERTSAGHRTVGAKDVARCPECGREFTEMEIDDLLIDAARVR
jgi:endogenous inhibitor of DNA gyrase (YacG/DUF329 family)